jgi:uncharacterized protein DUF3892
MSKRVTKTGKDKDGDITSLCGEYWSRTKADAIKDIDDKIQAYHVQDSLGNTADVEVVMAPSGKYLRTVANSQCKDNLDNLPDCQ